MRKLASCCWRCLRASSAMLDGSRLGPLIVDPSELRASRKQYWPHNDGVPPHHARTSEASRATRPGSGPAKRRRGLPTQGECQPATSRRHDDPQIPWPTPFKPANKRDMSGRCWRRPSSCKTFESWKYPVGFSRPHAPSQICGGQARQPGGQLIRHARQAALSWYSMSTKFLRQPTWS